VILWVLHENKPAGAIVQELVESVVRIIQRLSTEPPTKGL
jgi:hypothetical protein